MVTDSDKKYSICVYCASGPVDESFLALASEVGTAIGRRGWQVGLGRRQRVDDGGAVAESARAAGAWTVGVIPKALVHKEVADVDADELIVTDTMRERKKLMEDHADAFITLPARNRDAGRVVRDVGQPATWECTRNLS